MNSKIKMSVLVSIICTILTVISVGAVTTTYNLVKSGVTVTINQSDPDWYGDEVKMIEGQKDVFVSVASAKNPKYLQLQLMYKLNISSPYLYDKKNVRLSSTGKAGLHAVFNNYTLGGYYIFGMSIATWDLGDYTPCSEVNFTQYDVSVNE